MTRPGVYVTEMPLPRVSPGVQPLGTYGAFLGTAVRGPAVPVLVNNWNDFTAYFGGFGSGRTLPYAMHQYFLNGGGPAYVCRVLSSDAEYASKIYASGDPTPENRVEITAISPGAWGNTIKYDITTDSASSTFMLEIYQTIRGEDVVVERWRNLSVVPEATRYYTNVVNSPTIGSRFVRLSAIGALTTPFVTDTTAPVALASGSDGAAPTTNDYTTAFSMYDDIEGMFVVNCPGISDVTGIEAMVKARGDSILVVDAPENTAPTESIGGAFVSSYAAVYYPWVYISDPSPDTPRGSIIKQPPGPSVAGMIIRTDNSRGVFKAPAGVGSTLEGVTATEFRLTNTELDNLSAANVNVVRPMSGSGITVMGARTKSRDTAQYLSVRRTLNYIKARASASSRFAIFEPNTPALWEQCRVVNGTWLSDLWSIGGLAGGTPDQAYYVKCDEDINTPTTMSNGELHIEIGVAPAFPAEFVKIRVGQFSSDSSIVVVEEG